MWYDLNVNINNSVVVGQLNEKSFNIIYLKPATSEPKKKSLQAYKQLCTAADKKAEKIARKVLKKKTNKLLKKKEKE